MDRRSDMLFGALIADAASLGVHWLYDPDRIADLAKRYGSSAFVPVDPAHFEGAKGYFAHAARRTGMLSQYGEVLHLAIRSIGRQGGFDTATYSQDFAAHFGAGGAFEGYIDRPTRGALANIAQDITPSGIDDDQLPAVATLPAIVATYHGSNKLAEMARAARHVTNINEMADHYGAFFTDLLSRLLADVPLRDGLRAAIDAAEPSIQTTLIEALETTEDNSVTYAAVHGRACHLPMAAPLIVHILYRAESYADAIERNNRAGGDSAGRSIIIGAAMASAFGIDGSRGVPLEWALKLADGARLWADCLAVKDL